MEVSDIDHKGRDPRQSGRRAAALAGNELLLEAGLAEDLDRFCRQQGLSVPALLTAALQVLAHRYGGSGEAAAVEVELSARGAAEEGLKLCFEVHGELTGGAACRAAQEALASAGHGLSGADRLDRLPPEGLLIRQTTAGGGARGPELSCHRDPGGAHRLILSAGPDLTDVMRRSGSHLGTLLGGMMAKPLAPVSDLDLLAPAEVALLAQFSGAPQTSELCQPGFLHRLFEQTAARHPDRPAVCFEGRVMKYAALNAEANRLARLLRRRGAGPGAFVALYLPRSPEAMVALLAVLKSGAAYVPLDPGYPTTRVSRIVSDCGVCLVITGRDLGASLESSVPLLELERQRDLWANLPDGDLPLEETGVAPTDPAYAIYTSGSTGQPKGVQVSHAAVCNLVRAEGVVYGVRTGDRVFQGFSLAFDASVEEVWMAFYCGAALVIGPDDVVRTGPELSRFLVDELVTVFSTVPTQLSMMTDDVPLMRILILGGEECTDSLLAPWFVPDRQVFNTYGPTESTVIATCHRCRPDRKVTIGRPVPNYSIHVLDDRLRPVPIGVRGQLHIGGMSLADGYIGRQDLTREKFVEPPFEVPGGYPRRLYRSGDLARFNAAGELEFLGRADSQIKLRGYRVELSEIEAVLSRTAGVQGAVVAVHELEEVEHLVAYVIPRNPDAFDEARVRKALRRRLPRFMVPAFLEVVEAFPLLPSGKVDRPRLPPPRPDARDDEQGASEGPRSPTEQKVHRQWQRLFGGRSLSVDDDFFDLGGHSLLAARLVSRLRSEHGMDHLSIRDVYSHPTISGLAAFVDGGQGRTEHEHEHEHEHEAPSTLRHLVCGAAQGGSLLLLYLLFSLGLMVPFVVDRLMPSLQASAWIGLSLVGLVALVPATMLTSVALKWVLVGRVHPGSYPLWGWTYLRLWLVWRVVDMVPLRVLRGTWLLNAYYRLMGARIGRGVFLGSDRLRAFDLVTIGDGAGVGMDAHLMGYNASGGELHLAPVSVGAGCTVGARCVLSPGASLEDGAALMAQSMVPAGVRVPAGQTWGGSPARQLEPAEERASEAGATDPTTPGLLAGAAQLMAAMLVMAVPMVAMLPGIWLGYTVWVLWGPAWTLAATLPAAAMFVLLFCLAVVLIKWAMVGRVKPGALRVGSLPYVRKWTVDALMQLSLMVVQPLYATIYLPVWLRLMGASIGRHAGISTVDHISTALLDVADESFIADSASVGPPSVRHGVMSVNATTLGRRSFIGNSAVLPAGTSVGEGCLIGVLSRPPRHAERTPSRGTWLGSPPIHLPRRQPSGVYAPNRTFNPTAGLILARGTVELFKIVLPPAITTSLFVVAYLLLGQLSPSVGSVAFALCLPLLMLGAGLCAALITVAFKWVVVGRYVRRDRPLWSHLVWRSEVINALCENLAYPLLLRALVGTPFLPVFYRLLGCRLGRQVFLDTTELTEFDLISVGHRACLNYGCTVQTHLFEDRVMKMAGLRIDDDCAVGPMSVVLHDSHMEQGARLGGLSLLMKGETLPAQTRWEGSPARNTGYRG